MLLLDLPTELLGEIAGHLAHPREQASLAALARVNKLFNTLCTPLLNSAPSLTSVEQFGALVRTAETSWQGKTGDEAVRIREFALQDVKLQSLWLQPCHTCRSRAHDTKNHARCLLRLMSLVPTLFHNLRTLSFVDCMVPTEFVARPLGPLGTLRTSIESLTLVHGGTLEETTLQFLLEWLLFNHTSEVLCQGGAPATMDYVEPTQSQRSIAATDWQKFAELSVYAEWTEETERLYLESPPSAHPFSALTTLHISIASETGDEIFLIFLTGAFPSLRHLTIEGKFVAWVLVPSERFFLRRSIHRSSAPFQATFLPPKLTGLLPSPTELASFWLPLSPEEIVSPAFDTYRGPILDTLDLSALTLNLVP